MVEPSGHCPYLGLKQNQAIRFASPTPEHRCYVSGQAQDIPLLQPDYQEQFCLSSAHVRCPLYTGSGLPSTAVVGGAAAAAQPLTPNGAPGWFATLPVRDRLIYGVMIALLVAILGATIYAGLALLGAIGDVNGGMPPRPPSATAEPIVVPPPPATATAEAATPTSTGSPTAEPSPTAPASATTEPTATPTDQPTATPTAAPPTATPTIFIFIPPTPTNTPAPLLPVTPEPTATPEPTEPAPPPTEPAPPPTVEPTPEPTLEPQPTVTPEPQPEPTSAPEPQPEPTSAPEPQPEARTALPTPVFTPTN
jgi:hypothetical protein